MSFTVVCPQGVALRNTPNFNDRNQIIPGPTVGTVLQGTVVPGDGGLYYQIQQGFVPFYKQDGSVVLGPADQVVSCQVTKDSGIAYRKTADFNDRRQDIPGPSCGQIIIGIQVQGSSGQFLQTSAGFVPFADPAGMPLLQTMPPGTLPSDAVHTQQHHPTQPQAYPQQPQQGYAPQQPQAYPQQGYAPHPGAPPPAYSQGYPQQQAHGMGKGAFGAAAAAQQGMGMYGAPARPAPAGQDKRAMARDAFMRFDTDRSGTIELGEFVNAMALLGATLTYEDAQCVFCVVDVDGDGRITLSEFTEHWVANY